jgi:hypothetical protein
MMLTASPSSIAVIARIAKQSRGYKFFIWIAAAAPPFAFAQADAAFVSGGAIQAF